MGFNDFMNNVRQWDNRIAQWIVRHFYILFFEIILAGIFIAVFVNSLKLMDISFDVQKNQIIERLLVTQNINILLITILILFNSFWMLYIFSSMLRMRSLLRNMDYNLSKRRDDKKPSHD